MNRITFEETPQHIYVIILALPGLRLVEISKMVNRCPDAVIKHIRNLVQDGYVGRVRIGNNSLWYDSETAAHITEQNRKEVLKRERQRSRNAHARRMATNKARLERSWEAENDWFCAKPQHRIVCANDAPKIKGLGFNSVWQFAAQ